MAQRRTATTLLFMAALTRTGQVTKKEGKHVKVARRTLHLAAAFSLIAIASAGSAAAAPRDVLHLTVEPVNPQGVQMVVFAGHIVSGWMVAGYFQFTDAACAPTRKAEVKRSRASYFVEFPLRGFHGYLHTSYGMNTHQSYYHGLRRICGYVINSKLGTLAHAGAPV